MSRQEKGEKSTLPEESTLKRREIGVGLWSTALEPFRVSPRNSHQLLWKDMTHYGRLVGTVGYRTPDGTWLAKSRLPTSIEDNMDMPGLLFLRENGHVVIAAESCPPRRDAGYGERCIMEIKRALREFRRIRPTRTRPDYLEVIVSLTEIST